MLVELQWRRHGVGGCPLGSLAPSWPTRRGRVRCSSKPSRGGSPTWWWDSRRCAAGELRPGVDPAALVTAVMTTLQSGLLLTDMARSVRPLELALDMALDHVAAQRC
ncbi:MAG: hypothetical protein ACR2GH_02095 [Pseudonocardia sp.]